MIYILSTLYKAWLRFKFGDRLKISPEVIVPWGTIFIIDVDSFIEISSGVVLRDQIELRATRHSKLLLSEMVKLDRSIRIIATNNTTISIGAHCKIGLGTVFNGGGNITVGEKTLISGYVYLQTSMHDHTHDTHIMDSGYIYGDISIGRGSWLGVHAVVFPDVTLGDRVIVGSNAVVNRSFDNKSVVGGIPAKELK